MIGWGMGSVGGQGLFLATQGIQRSKKVPGLDEPGDVKKLRKDGGRPSWRAPRQELHQAPSYLASVDSTT